MQIIVLSIALVFSTVATAADVMRCGTDQFGNVVCLDTDGVLTTLSREAAGDDKGRQASGVPAAEPDQGRTDTNEPQRCGFDPFGNKVCRQ
jgi:hypothetical protein